MVTKNLDYLTAAMQLSAMVLWKADRVFPRQRRAMEKMYHLRNGIFSRV